MNGPEHYAEAERLLNLSAAEGLPGGPVRMERVAAAQVHATLAHVADTHAASRTVSSVEPGCTCGGTAACQQCQERDASTSGQGDAGLAEATP